MFSNRCKKANSTPVPPKWAAYKGAAIQTGPYFTICSVRVITLTCVLRVLGAEGGLVIPAGASTCPWPPAG